MRGRSGAAGPVRRRAGLGACAHPPGGPQPVADRPEADAGVDTRRAPECGWKEVQRQEWVLVVGARSTVRRCAVPAAALAGRRGVSGAEGAPEACGGQIEVARGRKGGKTASPARICGVAVCSVKRPGYRAMCEERAMCAVADQAVAARRYAAGRSRRRRPPALLGNLEAKRAARNGSRRRNRSGGERSAGECSGKRVRFARRAFVRAAVCGSSGSVHPRGQRAGQGGQEPARSALVGGGERNPKS